MPSIADNHVKDLISLGADAMSNMFDVSISLPSDVSAASNGGIADVPTALRLRVKGFKVPTLNIDNYTVTYKTVEINRPKSKITGDRSFDLTFRVDANYGVYMALKKWESLISNPATGWAGSNITDLTGAVTVSANTAASEATFGYQQGVNYGSFLDGASSVASWTFDNVWCYKVEEFEFNMEDSTPLEVTASFYFGNMTNPWTAAEGIQ